MTIVAVEMVRERDFAMFVQGAPEEELLRQRELMRQELTRLADFRTPLTELMRDRVNTINVALGLG